MRTESYLFRIGPVVVMMNIQYSSIGNSYPRLFLQFPDNSYSNVDLTIGEIFDMEEQDWNSWFTDTDTLAILQEREQVDAVLNRCGVDIEAFNQFMTEVIKYC